ncbi:hypothetical protein KC363_g3186 [Hortaea werneckii]|nr:hypothetical protein KC361_g4128 [Hortaea werneckii]KAI7087796.1 hypothetical protein KC356_g3889 [Hortaea werneckii]KAI7192636.1 hypothetical protein KC363_g3186 [Hortaea werneckii]KAI7512001.1 hypothetical protein KC347_g2854 [Hortaea werneckii]
MSARAVIMIFSDIDTKDEEHHFGQDVHNEADGMGEDLSLVDIEDEEDHSAYGVRAEAIGMTDFFLRQDEDEQ